MKKGRRGLYLLLAAGLLGLAAGGGTFASFNASTSNPGNTFATGSLYLSNTVGTGTACFSYNGASNANSNCDAVINPGTLQAPGNDIVSGTVTVANSGTIDGSTLSLSSSSCVDSPRTETVSSVALTNGSTTATISGNFTSDGVDANMSVVDSTTGANIPASTDVVSVTGSTLTLSNAAAASAASDTLVFTSLASTSGNPLCKAVVAYVQETGQTYANGTNNSYTYCWYGDGQGTSTCDTTKADLDALAANTDTLADLPASGSPLALAPLSSSGTTGAGSDLAAGGSRTFTVGLYLPDTSGSQNTLMDLQSGFSLTWQLAQ